MATSTKDRIDRLERLLGESPENVTDLAKMAVESAERISVLESSVSDLLKVIENQFGVNGLVNAETMERQTGRIKALEDELTLVKRALVSPREDGVGSKVKVPKPKEYLGTRSAKDLENFLWDMEQYFKAAKIPDEEQVDITCMYLAGDAKLWWRTKVAEDRSAGRPKVATWQALKQELTVQFLPHNASWVARERLRSLKQVGSVREYVKQFSSLMLDIKDMSEEDRLFNFMSGLQGWAQTELRRTGVKDIPTAMAAAEGLADFRMGGSASSSDKGKSVDGKKKKRNGADEEVVATDSSNKDRGVGSKSKGLACFICQGPHMARNCPSKEERVNAMGCQDDETESGAKGALRCNPLVTLNALGTGNKQVMCVNVRVNDVDAVAMLDTGASCNVMSAKEASRLGLHLSPIGGQMRSANDGAMQVLGGASITLRVRSWQGRVSVWVVQELTFDLILGYEFFLQTKAAVMPSVGGILIMDETSPCFVKASWERLSSDVSNRENIWIDSIELTEEVGYSGKPPDEDVGCF